MEYPNIEYILTYGSDKKNDTFIKGLFIAKKQKIQNTNLNGLIITTEITNQFELNGSNLEFHEKYIKDTKTETIYSWNDINVGIEDESIFLVTVVKDNEIPKKIWELPQLLFNYLEIKYCYIYSIIVEKGELCIQMIKYRTTINNRNRVIWSKSVIIPNKQTDLKLLQLYQNNNSIEIKLPKLRSTKGLNEEQYKKVLDTIYFKTNNKKIYLKDIELTKKDDHLLITTKKIHTLGHLLGYIDISDIDMSNL
jgi:hypothetical protein